MTHDRLRLTEQNIEQVRDSVHKIEIEQVKQGEQLSSINRLLERHEITFGIISETLSSMRTNIAVNTRDLQEHMRRTTELEKQTKEFSKFRWQATGIITVSLIIVQLLAKNFSFLK